MVAARTAAPTTATSTATSRKVTVSTDLKAIMASHQRMINACNDPDLDGDATLLVCCVATILYDRAISGRTGSLKRGSWLKSVCDMTGKDSWWIQRTIRNDIPRYKPETPNGYCTAPMIRREGPCGKRAIIRGVDRDPLTGVGTPYGYCTRHRNHDDDWRISQNLKAWNENGRPEPAQNAGGVLRRYLSTDWDSLYRWAAPYMTPSVGVKPPTLPRPKLVVLNGGC